MLVCPDCFEAETRFSKEMVVKTTMMMMEDLKEMSMRTKGQEMAGTKAGRTGRVLTKRRKRTN